jgi:hypothetical protein
MQGIQVPPAKHQPGTKSLAHFDLAPTLAARQHLVGPIVPALLCRRSPFSGGGRRRSLLLQLIQPCTFLTGCLALGSVGVRA